MLYLYDLLCSAHKAYKYPNESLYQLKEIKSRDPNQTAHEETINHSSGRWSTRHQHNEKNLLLRSSAVVVVSSLQENSKPSYNFRSVMYSNLRTVGFLKSSCLFPPAFSTRQLLRSTSKLGRTIILRKQLQSGGKAGLSLVESVFFQQ